MAIREDGGHDEGTCGSESDLMLPRSAAGMSSYTGAERDPGHGSVKRARSCKRQRVLVKSEQGQQGEAGSCRSCIHGCTWSNPLFPQPLHSAGPCTPSPSGCHKRFPPPLPRLGKQAS